MFILENIGIFLIIREVFMFILLKCMDFVLFREVYRNI